MKITTSENGENISVEVTVNVSIEQITALLQESVDNLHQDDPGRRFAVQQFLSQVYSCIQAVDESMIALLPPRTRRDVARCLREQADRYASEVPQ